MCGDTTLLIFDLRDNVECNHVDTSGPLLISCPIRPDAEEAGNDIRGHTHELGLIVGVTERLHDGGKEKRDGIERCVDTDSDEHVNPDLPVPDGMHEILDVVLIGKVTAIGL